MKRLALAAGEEEEEGKDVAAFGGDAFLAEGGAPPAAVLPPAHVGRARFLPETAALGGGRSTLPPEPGSRPPVLSNRSLARTSLMPIKIAASHTRRAASKHSKPERMVFVTVRRANGVKWGGSSGAGLLHTPHQRDTQSFACIAPDTNGIHTQHL